MRGVNILCCMTENEYEGVLAISTKQKRAEDRELYKSARSFVLSLVLALLALTCLPFEEANLFPKLTRGTFLESPLRKCLQHTPDLTVIGRQLMICAFASSRWCARLIICYGRRYLERTCVECGNGGWLEETMQQMRRAVIKKALSIVRKLKEDSESTR